MSVAPEIYELYFEPDSPPPDPYHTHWSGERYNRLLGVLGVENAEVTDAEVDPFEFAGMQTSRYFHTAYDQGDIIAHFRHVAYTTLPGPLHDRLQGTRYENEEHAKAIVGFIGDPHDAIYPSVDSDEHGNNLIYPDLEPYLAGMAIAGSEMIDGERMYWSQLTDKGRDDPLTKMVAYIFGAPLEGRLYHRAGNDRKGGASEFLSALCKLQFHNQRAIQKDKQQLHPVDQVAIAAGIACTIPFQPNFSIDEETGEITEGFVEQLGRRVHEMLVAAGENEEGAWDLANAILALGVHAANRDTGAFTVEDNFPALTNGARLLKLEDIRINGKAVLREQETTIAGLVRTAWLFVSAVGLYHRIIKGEIPANRVPKTFIPFDRQGNPKTVNDSYPPKEVVDQAVEYVEENIRLSALFFTLHEVGIVAAACFATKVGEPNAEVPGFVRAMLLRDNMMVPQEVTEANLDEDGLALHTELGEGTHQMNLETLTTQRSPIADLILCAAGLGKALRISEVIQRQREEARVADELDPYSDEARADELLEVLLDAVGPRYYNMIIRLLERAARYARKPERALELRKLLVAEDP